MHARTRYWSVRAVVKNAPLPLAHSFNRWITLWAFFGPVFYMPQRRIGVLGVSLVHRPANGQFSIRS